MTIKRYTDITSTVVSRRYDNTVLGTYKRSQRTRIIYGHNVPKYFLENQYQSDIML